MVFVPHCMAYFNTLCNSMDKLKRKFSFLNACFILRNSRWLLANVALESQLSLSSEILLSEFALLQNVSNIF